MRWIFVASLLVACRDSPTAAPDAGLVGPIAILRSLASAVPSAPAPPMADAAVATKPSARDVVERWNDAHVKHDAHALEGLYAPHLWFYGQTSTNKRCADVKRAAFTKSPDYTQSIRDVHTLEVEKSTSVTFTKSSTENGKTTDYPALLVVDGDGLISYESDKVTDANLAAREAANADWCTDQGEPSLDSTPNEKTIAPYKISSITARNKAMTSKRFHALEARLPGEFIVVDIITCPTKCDRAARDCGYELRVANHSNTQHNPSILVDWLYVDAVDGKLWYETDTGPQSE